MSVSSSEKNAALLGGFLVDVYCTPFEIETILASPVPLQSVLNSGSSCAPSMASARRASSRSSQRKGLTGRMCSSIR